MNMTITLDIEDAQEIKRILGYVQLSGIRQTTLEACEKCLDNALTERTGTITLAKPQTKIERIRKVIESEELSADAMVSEIGEIIGEED